MREGGSKWFGLVWFGLEEGKRGTWCSSKCKRVVLYIYVKMLEFDCVSGGIVKMAKGRRPGEDRASPFYLFINQVSTLSTNESIFQK